MILRDLSWRPQVHYLEYPLHRGRHNLHVIARKPYAKSTTKIETTLSLNIDEFWDTLLHNIIQPLLQVLWDHE